VDLGYFCWDANLGGFAQRYRSREQGGLEMKKTLCVAVFITLVLSFLFVVPAYAQIGFSDWVGQWLKGTTKEKGYLVADDGRTVKYSTNTSVYAYIQAFTAHATGPYGDFTVLLFQFNDTTREWDVSPYVLQVIGGTPLDCVGYGFIASIPGLDVYGVLLNAKGKDKKGVLSNIQIKSLSGYIIYNFSSLPPPQIYKLICADQLISAKGVAVDKVPLEVLGKLP
jgi:hypothetical protein